jgi:hypothetical protein
MSGIAETFESFLRYIGVARNRFQTAPAKASGLREVAGEPIQSARRNRGRFAPARAFVGFAGFKAAPIGLTAHRAMGHRW